GTLMPIQLRVPDGDLAITSRDQFARCGAAVHAIVPAGLLNQPRMAPAVENHAGNVPRDVESGRRELMGHLSEDRLFILRVRGAEQLRPTERSLFGDRLARRVQSHVEGQYIRLRR